MNLNYGTIGFLGVIIVGSLMLSQLKMTEELSGLSKDEKTALKIAGEIINNKIK
jgi:hypothetical protein